MSGSRRFTVHPGRDSQRDLRDAIRAQLGAWRVSKEGIERLLLAIDELVGNSIDHGVAYRLSSNGLALDLWIERHDVHLAFVDPDVPQVIARELEERLGKPTEPPPLDAERGRGLFLIGRALDAVELDWASGRGMTIRGVLRGVAP